METQSPSSTLFWLHLDDVLKVHTANEVLAVLEDGTVNLETPLSLTPDGPTKPVRKFLRELVWMSFMSANEVENETLEKQSPFRVAFDKSHAGLAITDLSGRIQYVNLAFAQLLGHDIDTLKGLLVSDISHKEDHAREIKLGNELFAGTRDGFQIQKRFKSHNGDWIPTLMTLALVRGPDSEPQMVVASIVDIREWMANEERKGMENELNALQKIARGVAHDYNNLLTVIDHAVFFLKQDAPGSLEDINSISEASDIAKKLNGQLETLGALGAHKEYIDIAKELRNQEPLLRHILGIEQTLYMSVPTEPVVVNINHAALEHVLLNLVVNATQAITKTGEIHISLTPKEKHTVLSVTDTGMGIPPELLKTIFDPFVSTKEPGRGLGLSIVKIAVHRCGCTLDVTSEVGKGTTVNIMIPNSETTPS